MTEMKSTVASQDNSNVDVHWDIGNVQMSEGNKTYDLQLSLAVALTSMHIQCIICMRTTKQMLSAHNIEIPKDTPDAILEAALEVGTDASILEPTMVGRIVKVSVTSMTDVNGEEVPVDSKLYKQIERRAVVTLVDMVVCDSCCLTELMKTIEK